MVCAVKNLPVCIFQFSYISNRPFFSKKGRKKIHGYPSAICKKAFRGYSFFPARKQNIVSYVFMPILCKRISAPYNLDRSYCTELIFLVKIQTLSSFIDIHLLCASYHGLFSLSKKLPCQNDTGAKYFLFPIFHCGFEQFHIKFAGYVLVQTVSNTFGVTHLTQYTTIGRKQTFDGEGRAVGVVLNIVCRVAVLIYILCENLTVFCQLTQRVLHLPADDLRREK